MTAVDLTPVRLTKTGRAGLKAVLDADQLDRADTGLRAPGWNAVVDLPDEWVEPVKPPLPAEPEPGPYLIGEFFALRRAGSTAPERWLSISLVEGGHRWSTWESLAEEAGCPDVPVRRAIPAPEPVTLPLRVGGVYPPTPTIGRTVKVDRAQDERYAAHLSVGIGDDARVWLTEADTRTTAYALLATIDDEGVQTHA